MDKPKEQNLDAQQIIDELSKIIGAKEFIISMQSRQITQLQKEIERLMPQGDNKEDK